MRLLKSRQIAKIKHYDKSTGTKNSVTVYFDVTLFFIWYLMYPLDIFLKCILQVILLFCEIILSVSEEAGCSEQQNVRTIKKVDLSRNRLMYENSRTHGAFTDID